MTLPELRISDLTKVLGNYYYLSTNGIFNCFFVRLRVNECDSDIDPISLKEMLTDLSNRVAFGNNFTSIADCLKLPNNMVQEAKALDLELYNAFRS